MARFVNQKGGQEPALIVYMPLVREYLELQGEEEIKEAISKAGPNPNATL